MRESELHQTPAPFLNRFEKYRLTHKEVLLTVKQRFSPCVNILLDKAYAKVASFVKLVFSLGVCECVCVCVGGGGGGGGLLF